MLPQRLPCCRSLTSHSVRLTVGGMDAVLLKLRDIVWRYAPGDPKAVAILEERIAAAGRKRALITYADLVRDVTFDLPSLRKPRVIDVAHWQEQDRWIVADFLAYISLRSYERSGFFSSALVVNKLDAPGEGFYSLLREVGLIPNARSARALDIWAEHVAKAHAWYARN
jgi:hypothetical protein